MPLNIASPGIVVKEVDLTIGRVDSATDKTAAIVAPFEKGPVSLPTLIENEQDLIDIFGKPAPIDKHYEYWLTASSYLAYGGVLNVVRASSSNLKNATDNGTPAIVINSEEDYVNKGYDETPISSTVVAARSPGGWANGLKVAIIDGKIDQTLTLAGTTGLVVGYGVSMAVPSGTVDVGAGTTSLLDGHFEGIITEINNNQIGVKFNRHRSAAGIVTDKDYQADGVYKFTAGNTLTWNNNSGVGISSANVTAAVDWFGSQVITLNSGESIQWDQIADRPSTSAYAAARGARFDELHVVVIDDKGTISGNAGTILDTSLNVSKAKDAEYSAGSASYWRKVIENSSGYIFAGGSPSGNAVTSLKGGGSWAVTTDTAWDQDAENIKFDAVGIATYSLEGGLNYDAKSGIQTAGALTATVGDLVTGYELFSNVEEYDVDFILMGAASHTKTQCQALANKCIAVAEARKDAVAFVSPYRGSFLTEDGTSNASISSAADITDNVVSYYSPITSTTYGVFDSGYKYMFDRFANTFRYIPLNGDIAGMCARNDINNFPWFSPAGTARGAVLNAVKLGYNPNQIQRDKLYTNRVNPVIFSPGAGIVLYGDKTGYGKASAFDRINVRRLFIYLEDAISAAAKDQLFEFNDEITRTNFVNIVEPFLRDVQAKRGIYDFRVICDETNNTAAIIDNNEFIADIFIKPSRSINFIGLTFVATRTGISFEEVIGTV